MTGGKKGLLQRWEIPEYVISSSIPGQKSSTKKTRIAPNLDAQRHLEVWLRSRSSNAQLSLVVSGCNFWNDNDRMPMECVFTPVILHARAGHLIIRLFIDVQHGMQQTWNTNLHALV